MKGLRLYSSRAVEKKFIGDGFERNQVSKGTKMKLICPS